MFLKKFKYNTKYKGYLDLDFRKIEAGKTVAIPLTLFEQEYLERFYIVNHILVYGIN